MQVHYLVSIGFNRSPHPLAGDLVRTDIQQDSCGIPHQRYGPVGDDDGTNDAGQGVHPEPPIQLGQDQTGDGQDGYEGIREDVDVSGADAVVAKGSLGGGARVLAAMGRVGGQALAVGAVSGTAVRVIAMVVSVVRAAVRAMGMVMDTVVMRVAVAAASMGRAGREGFCACVGWGHGVLRLATARSIVARSTVAR
jgi:hypothetical protein